MNQKRQRGLVGSLKVIQYVQVRTCSSATRQSLRNALKKIAALLRRRQFKWLWDIRKNPSEAWSDLGQFGRIVAYPPTVVFQTRGVREMAFDDLNEGEKRNRFVSLVTVPDDASEAHARGVLRHLHCEAGFPHAGSAPQHDD
jgi:hypothetical protein